MDVDAEDAEGRSSQPVSDWSLSDMDERPPTPGQRRPSPAVRVHPSSPDPQKLGNQSFVSQ